MPITGADEMDFIKDDNEAHGLNDPIIPIDFTPHDYKAPGVTFKPKWIHFFIAAFLAVTGSAAWFVLTAKSVFVEVAPITAEITIAEGLSLRLGQRYLIRPGSYQLALSNQGYHDTNTQLLVSDEQVQNHPFEMRKLPGIISFFTPGLEGARVQLDSIDLGVSPLTDIPIEPGEHQLTVSLDRYLSQVQLIEIEGRSVEQSYEADLQPAWATVSLTTLPLAADVLVDGELVGTTPINAEILQGRHDIIVKLAGHKAWQDDFDIVAGEDFSIPSIELEPADGLVFIRSNPSNASVTIGGDFKGLTPLDVALAPGQNHQLTFFKNGFHSSNTSIRTEPDEEREITIELDPVLTSVSVISQPDDAQLYVNGEYRGLANQVIELMAASQQIEIRKEGYVPFSTEFTSRPGLDQVIQVDLKSLEQARLEQINPVIITAAGQALKLFYPNSFTMGASRREAGRRPNENIRDIKLERAFYFGVNEVSNEEYRLFLADHSSGTLEGISLDDEAQPALRLTWAQAALYCNWLSDEESLPRFYEVDGEEVIGFNQDATGYRLPTEAEWAWIARTDGNGNQLKYSWGDQLTPPDNAGNFADISTQAYLGEILFNYDDGYMGTAPVGNFDPNYYGIYDMAGNVAEWVHDYYGAVGVVGGEELDPMGPVSGQFHTIRGSSWAHGSITELRLSFRDFGEEPRDDLGFRVARYLEE